MSEWHAIVMHGHERDLRAFVVGFLADRALDPSAALFAEDFGFVPVSVGERLRDLVGAAGSHAVLVPASVVSALVDAVSRADPGLGLSIVERRVVREARVPFEADVFSAEVAAGIRAALAVLPADVSIPDRREDERRAPDAGGVELYAPAHAYELRLTGTVTGAPTGVLEVRRRLEPFEVVRLGSLELVWAT